MTVNVPKTLSVLLVEDSPLDGRLLIEAIRGAMNAGQVVLQSVKTLAAAKAELERFSFSCVLLDLGLPDGRGTSNVSALREIDRSAAIVVLTGLDDDRSATEALKLGAQDYLIKGETDGEKLMKLIRRAVQRNRQTIALETRRDGSFFEASHDPQSQLPNRALFLDRARTQLNMARVTGAEFGVMVFLAEGLENFRRQFGAGPADELAQKLAQTLSSVLRISDTLARIDTEEFAVLLQPDSSRDHLYAIAGIFRERVLGVKMVGSCAVALTPRAGVAMLGTGETIEDLIDEARNTASTELGSLPPEAGTMPAVELNAVQFEELVGAWQPWAQVGSKRWQGLEFLPTRADGSNVFAAPQLSMTEAVELSLTMFERLSSQWQGWQEAGFSAGLLAVQLPAAALRAPELAQRLRQCLDARGLPTSGLQLEVPESVFKDGGVYLDAVMRLAQCGFRLCMRGDGSPDISLRELAQVPVNCFKLSPRCIQSLVEEGLQGPSRRFVTALVGVGQALGSTLIATGVDSADLISTVQVIGVSSMQGETVSPPIASQDVPAAWAQNAP